MITIYHNPRCKKSRAGLEFLKSRSNDIQVKEYLKEAIFTIDSLKDLIKKMGKNPIELIRTQEAFYKQNMKGKVFSDDDIIKLMVENPKLIIRPILVKGEKAIWGDPAEKIEQLF